MTALAVLVVPLSNSNFLFMHKSIKCPLLDVRYQLNSCPGR